MREFITGTYPMGLYTIKDGAEPAEGDMIAIDSSAEAQQADDVAGLVVVGCCYKLQPNGTELEVRDGIQPYTNSETHPLTRDDRGSYCYVEAVNTVSSDPGDNEVLAGVVVDVYNEEVFVDNRPASIAAAKGNTITGPAGADGDSPFGDSYTVLEADDTNGTTSIVSGLSAITSLNVQIRRAGVDVTEDAVVTVTDGTITVADGAATYALTAGDVIYWLASGTV